MYVCMYVVRQLKASAAESPPGRTVSHPDLVSPLDAYPYYYYYYYY